MAEDEDKTEEPSAKKQSDAREKGNVAKSNEINSVLVLLAGVYMIKLMGPWFMAELEHYVVETFRLISDVSMSEQRFMLLTIESIIIVAKIVLPIALVIMVIGVVSNVSQVGFLLTFKPLIPKFEKVDPIKGLGRIFSMRSIFELFKNIAKLTVIGFIAYVTIKGEFGKMIMLSDASLRTIWQYTVDTTFTIVIRIALVLIVLAVIDLLYQRFEHKKQLKMSKQEVKDEAKQMDGDPQVKARIRSIQREMARRRMMEEVPKATVVVTNPTHIAIALRYEPSEGDAPVVIAKGKQIIAQKIKELAYKNNIPVVEDKPLARAMYDKIEIGSPIPVEFFTAIAEIMAYVYRLKNRTAA
jgi:flagellar biosynthetic protein FlhB